MFQATDRKLKGNVLKVLGFVKNCQDTKIDSRKSQQLLH